MAKARMLHNKISTSLQVNRLSLPAKLLFTWMIAHADDEGRLRGEPEYIKAIVVPMIKWSFKLISVYVKEMVNQQLIYHWEQNNEWFIEFIKWKEYQSIKSDRFHSSLLPSFSSYNGNILVPESAQQGEHTTPQSNISESNLSEFNKSELKDEEIADKKSPSYKMINPKDFTPISSGESMAFDTWKRLEPQNSLALQTTYLKSLKLGLPEYKFGEFASQIEQDKTVINRGAVFNIKVAEYLIGRNKVQK